MTFELSHFSASFLNESIDILNSIKENSNDIDHLAKILSDVRTNSGRLFICAVGGSGGTGSHAVGDFRKIANIETYTPVDNISELTARTNDEGFQTIFSEYLKTSKLNKNDAVLVLSVGGGSAEKNVSVCIVKALEHAQEVGCKILGIVGKDGGYTKQVADCCVVIPPLYPNHITPHTEGLASVILHLLVSHPYLKINQTKWESVK